MSSSIQPNGQSDSATKRALKQVQDIFGLTNTQLAEVSLVEIDHHLNPASRLSSAESRRLFYLRAAANAWQESGYAVPNESDMIKPLVDDMSLYNALTDKFIDQTLVLFIGSRINVMSTRKPRITDPFEQ